MYTRENIAAALGSPRASQRTVNAKDRYDYRVYIHMCVRVCECHRLGWSESRDVMTESKLEYKKERALVCLTTLFSSDDGVLEPCSRGLFKIVKSVIWKQCLLTNSRWQRTVTHTFYLVYLKAYTDPRFWLWKNTLYSFSYIIVWIILLKEKKIFFKNQKMNIIWP